MEKAQLCGMRTGGWPIRVGALLVCVACSQCSGGGSPTTPTPTPPTVPIPTTPVPTNPTPTAPATFAGAGDIAICAGGGSAETARMLEGINGQIFTLGDNAYMSGSAREFRECYDTTWGKLKSRTAPVAGNHEYGSLGALPYYDYFGFAASGPSGQGYYAYDVGAWRVIALNSEILTDIGSQQGIWLQRELKENTSKCTLAYWHKPLFSSGPNGDNPHMRAFWRLLYEFGADVILAGHDHLYERFAPQDADGRLDPARGIRQFIVGTGGTIPLYDFLMAKPNSQVRISQEHGILKMTLLMDSYQWEFMPVPSARIQTKDSGSDSCH